MFAYDGHLADLDAEIFHLGHVGERYARDGSSFQLDRIDDGDRAESRSSHFPYDVDYLGDGSFEFRLESHVALRCAELTVVAVDLVGLDDDAVAVELDLAVSDAFAKMFTDVVGRRDEILSGDGSVRSNLEEAGVREPVHEFGLSLEFFAHHVVADGVNELKIVLVFIRESFELAVDDASDGVARVSVLSSEASIEVFVVDDHLGANRAREARIDGLRKVHEVESSGSIETSSAIATSDSLDEHASDVLELHARAVDLEFETVAFFGALLSGPGLELVDVCALSESSGSHRVSDLLLSAVGVGSSQAVSAERIAWIDLLELVDQSVVFVVAHDLVSVVVSFGSFEEEFADLVLVHFLVLLFEFYK